MSVADTTATPSSETDADNSFLDAITDALEDAGASDEHVDRVVAEGEQLVDERDELRQRVETLEQRVDEVDDAVDEIEEDHSDLDDYVEQVAENAAVERASHASRLSELEESTDGSVEPDSVDSTPSPETGETTLHDTVRAETPLEEAVNFPPQVAERELSENRLRGRFITRDIKQYATNVSGGWILSPSDMRTVISAYQGGGSVHPETLRRVRDFLSRWGKNEVTIRQREDGTNVVVFSNEIVDRLVKITEPDHTVVTGETATVG